MKLSLNCGFNSCVKIGRLIEEFLNLKYSLVIVCLRIFIFLFVFVWVVFKIWYLIRYPSTVRIYSTFLVLIVLLMWWGMEDWDGLDIWSMSVCRGLVVEGTRGRGRSRKTWEQCVRDDMKLLGLHPEWAVFRDMWRDLIWGKRLTLA